MSRPVVLVSVARSWGCPVMLGALLLGCEPQPQTPALVEPQRTPVSSSSVADPTAERLHDISGYLLLYYQRRQALPPSFGAMAAFSPGLPPTTDAASGRPLNYYALPLDVPGRPGGVIISSPTLNREGGHWAVLVKESSDGHSLTTQVVSLTPEELAAGRRAPIKQP